MKLGWVSLSNLLKLNPPEISSWPWLCLYEFLRMVTALIILAVMEYIGCYNGCPHRLITLLVSKYVTRNSCYQRWSRPILTHSLRDKRWKTFFEEWTEEWFQGSKHTYMCTVCANIDWLDATTSTQWWQPPLRIIHPLSTENHRGEWMRK
jgi:hypothetical protein